MNTYKSYKNWIYGGNDFGIYINIYIYIYI